MLKFIPFLYCLTVFLVFFPCDSNSSEDGFQNTTENPAHFRIDLTEEEKKWLEQNPVVRARIGAMPPLHFFDGQNRGISVDYLNLIAEIVGFQVEYVHGIPWDEAIESIKKQEKFDILLTAKNTKERQQAMRFTDDYLLMPWVIFTRTDGDFTSSIKDLFGKTVAVEKSFVMQKMLMTRFPDINLLVKKHSIESLQAVASGEADAYIGNLATSTYIVSKHNLANLKVACPAPIGNHNQAFVVRNDWPELVSILNKAIKGMPARTLIELRNNWFNLKYEYGISTTDLFKWIGLVVGSCAFLLLFFALWNQRLKNEIKERKKADEDKQKIQVILKTALDSMTDAVFISDATGRFVEFNTAFATFHKFKSKNACYSILPEWHNILDVFLPNGQLVPLDMWAVPRALRGEQRIQEEFILQRKDTGEKWTGSYNFAPIRGKDGAIVGSVVVGRDITEKRKAEKQLNENEEKFRALFDQAGGYCMILDPNTSDGIPLIIDANKAACEAHGYTREEFIGRYVAEIEDEDGKRLVRKRTAEIMTGEPFYVENVHVRKNGTTFPVAVNAKRIDIRNSKSLILTTEYDITERKTAEKQIKESQERFELAMEAAQDGLYDWNLMTNEIYYSPGWKRMLGYQAEELPNDFSVWEELTEPEDVKKTLKMQQDLVKKKLDRFELEFKMKHKNGHWMDILTRAKAIFDDTGKAVRIVGTHVDISERKRATQETADALEMLSRAEKMAKLGTWSWNPNTNRVKWSDNMCRLYGIEPYEFDHTYDYANRFTHPDDLEEINKFTESLVTEKKPRTPFEYRIVTPAGQVKWVIGTSHILFNNKGEIKEVVGTTQDITDRKKMEAQIQQASKMESIGTLAAGIAHDFNNILSAVLGHGQMAIEQLPISSPIREDIHQVMVAGNRAADLVKQILLYTRQGVEDFHPLRLHDVLHEVVSMFRSSLPSSIEFRILIDQDCGFVLANPTQIHQVIMNLCTNARQAIQNNYGTISLTLSEVFPPVALFSTYGAAQTNSRYACMQIRDSGKGIPEKIKIKIFDPFFTTKPKNEGTGLGLSVVDGIIRKHNGLISLESDAESGTTFNVYLPIVQQPAVIALPEVANLPQIGDERILLIDDEELLNEMNKRVLDKLGYQVTCFSNSLLAFKDFQKNPDSYDIIVTDMTMPQLTGLDLVIEALQLRPDIKSILCTGYSKTVSEMKAKSCGVSDYLLKPVLPRVLAEIIRKVLDNG